jgi:hypothetical protein
MYPHALPLLLALIAIPSFLLGPLLSTLMPIIVGAIVAPAYQAVKKASGFLDGLPSWAHQGANFALNLLFTKGLMLIGVSLTAATAACVADPNTANAAACLTQQDVELIVRGLIGAVTAHVVHSGIRSAALKRVGRLPA